MTRKNISRLRPFGALAITTLVVACSTPGADTILSLPEETQRDAFRRCSAQLDIPLQLQKLNMRDGRVNVFAVNGNGVTLGQARSMNKCAQATMLAEHG